MYKKKDIAITSAISVAYLLLSRLLIGFKTEQLYLVAFFNVLYYLTPGTRKFITGFSVFIVYWIVFDFMKAFPNYRYNTVHIESLYNAERHLFGIHSGGQIITPNEFWLQHKKWWLDAMSGFFYLCWVPVPLLFAVYLFYKKRAQFLQFALCFFLVNLLGFVVYYVYPAAPPWYVEQYGFVFNPFTPGNTAGLQRFDDLFHVHIFQGLYAKSSNVFAAMPSLHASYLAVVLFYCLKNRLYIIGVLAAVIMLGIWFAAVYSSHHYVLDVLAGIACAVAGIGLFSWLISGDGKFRRWYDAFLYRII
ncbi:MAG: inositol phosphorylceramide synthase [Bacteroidetes bacterium]|nr:inositol phosphorylceramide synthase [Bacteroidota bacterium]